MPGKARLYILIAIMAVVALSSSLVAGWVQYDAAFTKKKALLTSIVKHERFTIEEKLIFQAHPPSRNPKVFISRLKQHLSENLKFDKFGKTGEIVIAQLVDKKIHFLVSTRNIIDKNFDVDFNSSMAEPMRRALLGFSGVVIGKDYGGTTVLAAFEPLGNMGLGIVAKVDIAEIREPFIKAGLIAAMAAVALMFVGAILFYSVINPILQKARANEQEFRNLYDHAPVIMHSINRHGRIRYVNKQWLDFMGYEPDEVIGKKIFDFQTPSSVPTSEKAVDKLAAIGEVTDVPIQLVKKNGDIRDVLITAVSQGNNEDGRDDSVSVVMDVTEQRRTESLLKQAVESFSSGFALFDKNERLVLCNENYRNSLSHIGDILEPGISKLALLRAAVARNKIPAARGREEAWLEERLKAFREHENTYIRETYDGKWIKVDNFKTADGGTVLLRNDITELRQAENALRASEERFRKLIESASQGILVHTYRKPLYANQALADMYGYDSPEEILALGTTEALIAEEYRTDRHERRLSGEPISPDVEYEGIRKDGTRFWAEKRTFLIEWDGEIASCSVRIDIDERKKAEETLKSSEVQFRTFIDNLPMAVNIMDINSRYVMVNRQFQDWYGYSTDDVVLKTRGDVFGPTQDEITETVKNHIQDVIRTKKLITCYRKRRLADGRELDLEVTKFPIFDERGNVIRVGSITADVTERKRSEQALRDSEAQFRIFIDTLPMAVNIKDIDGRYLLVNKKVQEWHGKRLKGFIGKTHQEVFGSDVAELTARIDAQTRQTVETGGPVIRHVKRTLRNGRVIDCEVNKFPIFDEKGNIIRVGSITTDVTERKQSEEALRKSEERFRGAIESLQEAFALYDSDDRLIVCNDEYLRLHPNSRDIMKPGMKFEDMIRRNVYSGINADALGREEEHLRERLEQHRNPKGPVIRKLTNGTWFIINESRTPEGGYCVTEIDITELKQIEAAL
ncbi:MAG: PAS domain S-box protein, partial [Rhodospirillales bacterium]